MRALALAIALTTSFPAASQSFSGEWQEFALLNDYRWDEGRCAMALLFERRWNLQARPGSSDQLYGMYTGVLHGRLYRNQTGTCRASGQKSVNMFYANMRFWEVEGFSSGNTARLQAKYVNCEGDNCSDPTLSKEGFIANLVLEGDALRGLDEGKPDQPAIMFHRPEWHQARTEEAKRAFDEVLAVLTGGTREEVRARLTPALTQDEMDQLIGGLPIFRTAAAGVATRELLDAKVTEIPPSDNNVHRFQRSALLVHQVNMKDGAKMLEIAFLHLQDGAWKLAGIYQ